MQKVDNYFYVGGKKARVIRGRTKNGQEKVVLFESKSSSLVTVAKLLSYCTIGIPIFMLIAKAVLRLTHRFKLIDPKSKLEKRMDISEETVAKIQQLIPTIIKMEDDPALDWLAKGNNLVFRIKETPEVVYKLARPSVSVKREGKYLNSKEIRDERFNNMVKAKEVCLTHELGLLIIPHAKKIDVKAVGATYVLIAEESLDIESNESAENEHYHKYSPKLNETVRQLAVFVSKTGFNDVTWRNIPIINEADEFHGPRRVALIDLEHMNSKVNGFIGDENGSCGLIGCVSEEQIDLVIEEALEQGVIISGKQSLDAKNRRLTELESNKNLRAFYEKKGIITGKEPIQVDIDFLGLDLNEKSQINVTVGFDHGTGVSITEEQTFNLRKVTEDIIAEINRLIQDSSDKASTRGQRFFVLNTHNDPFNAYSILGLSSTGGEGEKQLWLHRIISALVDKGHIFKLVQANGHGYFIQA